MHTPYCASGEQVFQFFRRPHLPRVAPAALGPAGPRPISAASWRGEPVPLEVPSYPRLQEEVVRATEGFAATSLLDLGTGTGETLAAVLAVHPGAQATGIDESAAMLEAAKARPTLLGVELLVADIGGPLPPGPFDLVVSALAVHHLDGPGKAALFGRIAAVLRPGGRFVLGDVVIPEDPRDAVVPVSDDYDRPSTAVDQLAWLAESGFEATVTWAERDLVVLRAEKPRSAAR